MEQFGYSQRMPQSPKCRLLFSTISRYAWISDTAKS
jgi:hypothetical protein